MLDHFRKLNNQPAGQCGTEAAIRIGNVVDPLADPLGEDDEEAAEDEGNDSPLPNLLLGWVKGPVPTVTAISLQKSATDRLENLTD